MSITFITGKPGGGKGLLAMQQVVEEIRLGTRPIITNLAVRVDPWVNGKFQPMIGLRVYLTQKFQKDFGVGARIYFLNDDTQTASFYLWRVVDGQLVSADHDHRIGKNGEKIVTDYDMTLAEKSGPAVYVIDEAWKFYSARKWQATGEGALTYSAQHRHFGDDVFIVTQHTKQIDPAMYRVAQDFWVVRNHSKMSIGAFRQPDVFSVSIYDQPPTGAALEPMSHRVFTLDRKGLAQTYDTSAGVGHSGRMMADVGERRRGLPWWGLPILILLACVVVWQAVRGGGWAVGKILFPAAKPAPTAASNPAPKGVFGGVSVQREGLERPRGNNSDAILPPESAPNPGMNTNVPPVDCRGWCFVPGGVQVFLSDGRVASSAYGEVDWIRRRMVRVFGEEFPVHVVRSEDLPSVPSGSSSDGPGLSFPPVPTVIPPAGSPVVTVLGRGGVLPGPTPGGSGFQRMANQYRSFGVPVR